MSDLNQLEFQTLSAIAAAQDESALEAVRVAALGKKGSVSALLCRRLARCRPTSARPPAPAINALKDKVSEALGARRSVLKDAALEARLSTETIDVTLPVRESPIERGRIHPISQVMDELTAIFADMGFCHRRRPGRRDRRLQFHQAEFPRRPSGARNARHVLSSSRTRTASANCCAPTPRPVQVRTMLAQQAAHSRHHARAAPIAAIPIRPTRRCSIRSKGW